VDGEAIECTLDGPPAAMDDDDILPFAIVCRFPEVPRVGLGEQDFAGFAASVEGELTSRNLFHAVRFDGVLSEVRVRVTPRQHHPFPRLAEVTSHQVETVARDIRGMVVGFWTPAIYQGIAVAGLHLHFLSVDHGVWLLPVRAGDVVALQIGGGSVCRLVAVDRAVGRGAQGVGVGRGGGGRAVASSPC
jgi:acetolactate decarboxylase